MLERYRSGDPEVFEMFAEIASRVAGAAKLLRRLLAEPARLDQHAAAIEASEHEANRIAHDLRNRLSEMFLGPIDPEDAHALTSQLGRVIRDVGGIAKRAASFRLTETREPALWLADVLVEASECLGPALPRLRDAAFVSAWRREVETLEEEGEAVHGAAIVELFAGRSDPLEVLKWKALYDQLEEALDACARAARVLQRISLRHTGVTG